MGEDLASQPWGGEGPLLYSSGEGEAPAGRRLGPPQLQLAAPPAKPAQLMSAPGSAYVQQEGAWPGELLLPLAPSMVPHQRAPCLCAP